MTNIPIIALRKTTSKTHPYVLLTSELYEFQFMGSNVILNELLDKKFPNMQEGEVLLERFIVRTVKLINRNKRR